MHWGLIRIIGPAFADTVVLCSSHEQAKGWSKRKNYIHTMTHIISLQYKKCAINQELTMLFTSVGGRKFSEYLIKKLLITSLSERLVQHVCPVTWVFFCCCFHECFFVLFLFFSRQNCILSRKQILTYIGRIGPKETDYSTWSPTL